ncbi:hypothetical protein UM93_12765 [Psychromicrobium lacuslunae]|uniref:Uncharacterized protein n=1 Tax=Psychromicrobium lacuslunae TaxID=1618207 RepID=A0A0D4C0F7_9MICC|nr:hypothetical protein UM93_12765 [Psychromicrobium lacuslunae]
MIFEVAAPRAIAATHSMGRHQSRLINSQRPALISTMLASQGGEPKVLITAKKIVQPRLR